MWIPRQIWFWPVVESAYNAQNAQFGLVVFRVRKKVTNLTINNSMFLKNCLRKNTICMSQAF